MLVFCSTMMWWKQRSQTDSKGNLNPDTTENKSTCVRDSAGENNQNTHRLALSTEV